MIDKFDNWQEIYIGIKFRQKIINLFNLNTLQDEIKIIKFLMQ